MRRRSIRKQKGTGCGCGGMEMLGFPKAGGFLSLFGGQEEAVETPPGSIGQDSSVVMKEASPQEMRMKKSDAMMKEASPQEIVSDYEVRNSSTPRKGSMSIGVSSDGERPKRPERGERIQEIVSDYEVRNSSMPRRTSMSRGVSSDGERPKRPERGERMRQSSSPLKDEIRIIKQDIETLKNQVSELQSSSGSSTTTTPGLFGGRRKTLRRMRKHRR